MALEHGLLLSLLLFLLAHGSIAVSGTAARDFLLMKKPKDNIVAMNGGEHVDCWSSLMELKSCSNEIVLYFTNGEADIGLECCCAITVITHNCWPAMLTSLGFTPEEGHYLRGYCDDTAAALAPAIDGSQP